MTLIHTALFSEARPVIDFLQLKQYDTKPFKIFKNKNVVLIVSGVGGKNTINALELIFSKYKIEKAINIGIAGCKDKNIEIGTLFCTNQNIKNIPYATLTTTHTPVTDYSLLTTALVDMEADYFIKVAKKFLTDDDTYIFKIVSDHLDATIPKKEFVNNLIRNSIEKWYSAI